MNDAKPDIPASSTGADNPSIHPGSPGPCRDALITDICTTTEGSTRPWENIPPVEYEQAHYAALNRELQPG